MPNNQQLNTTEEIINRLEIEYHACYQEVVNSILNCVAHKTDFLKKKGRPPALCPQWEHSQHILDARDSLHYRLGCLMWHVRMFKEHQHKHANAISELLIKGADAENQIRDAYHVMGYLLDDVIFKETLINSPNLR